MATESRIYLVKPKNSEGRLRLVRARNAAEALKHVVDDTFDVFYASQEDIVDTMLAQNNTAVEAAGVAAPNPSN